MSVSKKLLEEYEALLAELQTDHEYLARCVGRQMSPRLVRRVLDRYTESVFCLLQFRVEPHFVYVSIGVGRRSRVWVELRGGDLVALYEEHGVAVAHTLDHNIELVRGLEARGVTPCASADQVSTAFESVVPRLIAYTKNVKHNGVNGGGSPCLVEWMASSHCYNSM